MPGSEGSGFFFMSPEYFKVKILDYSKNSDRSGNVVFFITEIYLCAIFKEPNI
jgi:hypothetical protein